MASPKGGLRPLSMRFVVGIDFVLTCGFWFGRCRCFKNFLSCMLPGVVLLKRVCRSCGSVGCGIGGGGCRCHCLDVRWVELLELLDQREVAPDRRDVNVR